MLIHEKIVISIFVIIFFLRYLSIQYKLRFEPFSNESSSLNKPRICICMNHTPEIYAYSKITEKINRAYARQNGYDFKIFNIKPTDRAPQWCKIEVINQLLENPKYDYLFWIDADAFFNKFDTRIEHIINQVPDKHLCVCDDIKNSGKPDTINTGTLLVKNSDWSKKFFKQVWNYDGQYRYDYFHEQTVIQNQVKSNSKEIQVFPATDFNTAVHEIGQPIIYDRFVIHLMGSPKEFRVDFLSKWLEKNPDKI